MALISDPGSGGVSNSWSGTNEDDLLIYQDGRDVINGGGGYDTLKMPFPRSHYVYSHQNGIVSIDESPSGNPWSIDLVTGIGIEEIQFFDQTVTLVPRPSTPPSSGSGPSSPPSPTIGKTHSIQLGSGGSWKKGSWMTSNDTWWRKKGKGRNRRYLVDNDVDVLSGVNASTDTLALDQGNWSNVFYESYSRGTLLFNGSNIIAFLNGFSASDIGKLNLQ